MTPLLSQLNQYVDIRRNLGFKFATPARMLMNFVAFADCQGAEYVTANLFLRWRESFGHANLQTWSLRLGWVRQFAGWLASMDGRHEVPPRILIPAKPRRSRPYIYTDEQIREIVRTAADLPSVYGIRGLTYSTLFGLIAVTGLRISEAIALDNTDIDLIRDVVGVRYGKFGKERLLPVSQSTSAALRSYAKERNRLRGGTPVPFFVSDQGTRVTDCAARYAFAAVSRKLGLRPANRFRKHGRGPRVHDLRHTFGHAR